MVKNEDREDYQEFLKDVGDGKVHGIGMGFTEMAEHIAFQYLMRGFGEYVPDEIDKKLIPKLTKIIVKKFSSIDNDEGHAELVDVKFIGENDSEEHFEFSINCCGHGGTVTDTD